MMKLDEWTVHELQEAGQLDYEESNGKVSISRELGHNGHNGMAKVVLDEDVFLCSDCTVEVDWMNFRCDSMLCGEHQDVMMGVSIGGVFNGP